MKLRTLITAMSAALCAILLGCSTGATKMGMEMAANGENTFVVQTAPDMTTDEVHHVITSSLMSRGWTVTGQKDGEVDAELDRLEQRHIHGIIKISYTEKQITITDCSVNEKGEAIVPVRWIAYLKQSLQMGMGLPVE